MRTLALSRLAWTLHLTLDVGMDLRRAVPLALRSSRDAQLSAASEAIVYDVGRGRELTEAMADTGVFPRDFLDVIEVGERSGRLPEQLGVLSNQYQDHARRALATITVFAGFGVWLLVAALIILLIFRIFSFYLGTINDALQGV
jgi:type IV pilus assembly protein PilC